MIEIKKATYGGVDCTEQVIKKLRGGSINLKASNDIIGDTDYGKLKHLLVDYEINGVLMHKSVVEGDFLIIRSNSVNKLGVFYSNNNNPSIFPAIQKSLETIEKASRGVADIVTCVWNPIEANPFVELISWVQNAGHLNQLLQIMQCLYFARNSGQYEWVSFLEHDVMYPEDYFSFNETGYVNCVFTNENYIGICEKGFQDKKWTNQFPFHQMTMRFEDAIKHCESILSNALITNSGIIEPGDGFTRRTWSTKNPSVHINHGVHFTSHFETYKSNEFSSNNEYWGHYSKYLDLFKKLN